MKYPSCNLFREVQFLEQNLIREIMLHGKISTLGEHKTVELDYPEGFKYYDPNEGGFLDWYVNVFGDRRYKTPHGKEIKAGRDHAARGKLFRLNTVFICDRCFRSTADSYGLCAF